MSASKATFTTLPPEIHMRIFSFIEAHYFHTGKIHAWKNDPLPREFKQLAFINQQWRRLVIGIKFRRQHLLRTEDVREFAHFISGHPVVTASLRDLTIAVAHTDLSELLGYISKWSEEGSRLQRLAIGSHGGTSHTQVAGTQEGSRKYTLFEFSDSSNAETGSSVPIAVDSLDLKTSIPDASSDSNQILQLGNRSMDALLSRLDGTRSLWLHVYGVSRSRRFLRTMYNAACGYIESIIELQDQSMKNLTTLSLTYPINMRRMPYSTSTRSFYLDENIDERGDNLSNLLRKLSKRLKEVMISYDRVTSEIFEPRDGVLSDGETEDWPYLHTFRLYFRDIDAYGYRRSELQPGALQNTEGEEEDDDEEELELTDGDQEYQDIPKDDNDGFDWLNADIIDDMVKYEDDRDKRTATSGVRNFYLVAAKAVANRMHGMRSFQMEMNLSWESRVLMDYSNQSLNPKKAVFGLLDGKQVSIGYQILESKDLPESEDGESDNELTRIFKEGLGEDVKIRYSFPPKGDLVS
ncbi:hypothetical protein EYR41_004216 [Orbilia oligospora]|uniref:F-box domain-containing protein n=1 Tax=Orbilia oligospora TaxID=2813651 RepID=A0A8H2E7U2_ORBOL|nr:hypothetical protein EYR41_004216 [Orbilia oligospora]